jgi:two-component sensor histidine kinase
MHAQDDNPILQAPFRWFLKAATVGLLCSVPPTLLFSNWNRGIAWRAGIIGMIFALIMWAGFEFCSPWLRASAGRSVLAAQVRWLGLYVALFFLCVGLVRVILGWNVLENFGTGLFSFLLGYAISSSIVGYYSAKALAAAVLDLEKARGAARIQALKTQLSPHTLFNALNTIAALIPGNPSGAEAAVEDLSRFLRRTLEALERDHWTLAEEFDLIAFLLNLERARFGERLTVRLDLPDAEAGREIPPLLLLPLVENSLKHGFRPKVGPCSLSVCAAAGVVRVEDDGVGRAPGAPDGVGLGAVRTRLEAEGRSLVWPPVKAGCVAEVRLCR